MILDSLSSCNIFLRKVDILVNLPFPALFKIVITWDRKDVSNMGSSEYINSNIVQGGLYMGD